MPSAMGLTVHTGWAACVVCGGTPAKPEILANEIVEILGDAERFCFHMAAKMPRSEAEEWIAGVRKKALANSARALKPFLSFRPSACAIVAKPGESGSLDRALASHPRLHTAEGTFYRDVLREACGLRAQIVSPKDLDVSTIGRLAPPPWGKDQKLAAVAAWRLLEREHDRG